MTSNDTMLLLIKGIVSDLPPDEQEKVKDAALRIQAIVDESYVHGSLALSIVAINVDKTYPAPE